MNCARSANPVRRPEDERGDLLRVAVGELAGLLGGPDKAVDDGERLADVGSQRSVLAADLEQEAMANRKASGEIEIGPHYAIQDAEGRRGLVFGFFEGSVKIIEIGVHHGFEQGALVLIMTVRSGLGDARRVSDRAKRHRVWAARVEQPHR